MAKKSELIKKESNIKKFDYAKGEVSLNFTLTVDDSSRLRDFKVILEAALNDVTDQIKKLKN
jgi:hypothetical protein